MNAPDLSLAFRYAAKVVCPLVLGACAAGPETQVAQVSCKVEPATTANTVTKRREPSELDRKWAEAQLRSSDYYRNAVNRDQNSAVVEVARNCP